MIACNTVHKVADYIQSQISIPLLHIADLCAGSITGLGIQTVGLLGTRHTTEGNFSKVGLKSILPSRPSSLMKRNVNISMLSLRTNFVKGYFFQKQM
ncbi:aspartate/glutamate racemase family protein [Dyadobacter sp. 676]|uniref:Aspartate/glutamate racemase family protein n=1 Tax=Dyadobacter sp. 676 TaxID=3088362 RepID=A0AAU8FVL3_9BACT